MFTGDPSKLPQLERQAAEYARQIADLLTRIDQLGIGTTIPGQIRGPGVVIRGGNGRWTVQT
ncbi:hypothetical protein ACFTXJ_14415 [Streptomyces zhihengii]|uniref:hypothetical protein n=1 Tax=Streptomyces zhihengii TaxID=1818004 RepID=UPI003644F36B